MTGTRCTTETKTCNLTRSQLQVWTAQKLLPDQPIYNIAVALTLSGKIELCEFRKAFQKLIDSVDALRTVFEEVGGVPTRRVLPDLAYEVPFLDLSHASEPHLSAKRWMQERCLVPFDVGMRLFDTALIKLTANEFVWYLNMHHLISDAWSVQLIYEHTAEFYELALARRLPDTVTVNPFETYGFGANAEKSSVRYRKAEAYWKQKLAFDHEPVRFYGLPVVKTCTRVSRKFCELGLERSTELRRLIRKLDERNSTEATLLLNAVHAIVCIYLARIHDNWNYFIGMVSHNRRQNVSKQTIGFFSEVLPVRASVRNSDTFASLMRQAQREIFETVRHGNFAVANPINEQVYDIVVNYLKTAFNDFAGIPARPEWIHTGYGFESFSLLLHDFVSSGMLGLSFDFHNDVFSNQQAEMAVRHFLAVLDAILKDPANSIADLQLVSAEESKCLLSEWNGTARPLRTEACVHILFERQAQKTPDATAVAIESETFTYRELNSRANQLARHLEKLGVGPETLVGVYTERSLEMLVAILATLKAGGAYAPLDPSSPPERLRAILKHSDVRLVLTQRSLLENLPLSRDQVLCLDSDWEKIRHESDENLRRSGDSSDLAYVIYTSGSTGAPKAVEITNQALVNFTEWASANYNITPTDRVLQFAPISFDGAVEEIFPCLTQGATLVLRTDLAIESIPKLLANCRDWNITVLDLPTSYWHVLTKSFDLDKTTLPESVRLVIIGGEKVSPKRLADWQKSVSRRCRLVNTYGPTEATVVATACDLSDVEARDASAMPVSIGRPIANARAFVLDRQLNLVPVGVGGELFIGGIGLARGYRNDPDLTAEKFLFKDIGSGSKERLYRTGDLARYRRDGQLEFLGRLDDQVKIMGYRVEPREIENALAEHPGVDEVCVTAFNAEDGQSRLAAYVISKPGAIIVPTELRAFLVRTIPPYMLPAAILFTGSFPRTSSGKIDRNTLPPLDKTILVSNKPYMLARTPVERALADIWSEVLGFSDLNIQDNFFNLGGHSLTATQVMSRIRETFRLELPLRAIFEAPTIAGLANHIQLALQNIQGAVERPPLTPVGRSQDLPLSSSQTRMWFMHKLAPQSPAYNLAVALRLTGDLNLKALIDSFDEIGRRHEAIRTIFPSVNGQPRQAITEGRPVTVRQIDLRTSPPEERLTKARHLVSEDARRPFDLERDLLIRLLLIQMGEDAYILTVTMHHIAGDQWSMGIIARELTQLYNAFCSGLPAQFTSLPLQYADFAAWQREWLNSELLQRQVAYWKEKLADLQPLNLPMDRPRPSVQTFNGRYLARDLSKTLLDDLKRLSVEEGVTLYMTFLAAFKALLSRYSSQTDIAIGSPVANRNWLALEGIVGSFVNTLVLRTNVAGNPSFRELLRRVRDVTVDAYARQETPFEKIVEELHPQRDTSLSPLVHTFFNFQNAPLGDVKLHGVSWSPFEFELGASQFDLCLAIDPALLNKIVFIYNPDLFDESRIARMSEHYINILRKIVTNRNEKMHFVEFLTDNERRLLRKTTNGAQADLSTNLCAHELFQAQVERSPKSAAVSFEGQTVTYETLNGRANQLAHYLRTLGVGREVAVAIYMERCLDVVVGLLGILKAGGAYVPLDPGQPSKRTAMIVEDSATQIIVTQERLIKALPQINARIVCLDRDWTNISRHDDKNPVPLAESDDLVYVIYTSGSTGRPKGVEVTHKALVNFLISMGKEPGIGNRDVMLAVTPLTFDISALELFLPLTVGAQVIVVPVEITMDPRLLKDRVEASSATMMQATPMMWRMLLEASWKGKPGLKILCGGEALPKDLAEALLPKGDSLFNLYGPTETSIWSTVWKVAPGNGPIVLGHPIDNTQIYVLDTNLQIVPFGVEGEIYIGGAGVARGYRGNPKLSDERFIKDPFNTNPTARLFKTGDRARCLPDGNIEHLGRIDFQVKLRGYRIELGEIESILSEHPAVKQCVVLAREGGGRQKQLLAYVVPVEPGEIGQNELQRHLRERLPSYMIPTGFVMLKSLPLTPNGKVDREAFPSQEPEPKESGSKELPRNPLELQLVNIWQKVLGVQAVGITDNFFELGGHSLLAVRLIAEIQNLTGTNIPTAMLFRAPTIEQLSTILQEENRAERWFNLLPIQASGSKVPLFLIHGETINLFLPELIGIDRPLFSLEHQSQDGKRALYKEVETIAEHYLQEIRSVQAEGPYLLAGYSFGGVIAFEIAQKLLKENQEVALLALIDTLALKRRRDWGATMSFMPTFAQRLMFPFAIITHTRGKLGSDGMRRTFGRLLTGVIGLVRDVGENNLNKMYRSMKRAMCEAYVRLEHPIPPALRSTYILNVYEKAIKKYVPQPFSGRVVYFKSAMSLSESANAWGFLVKGDFTVREIPGGHLDMRERRYVNLWAPGLKTELEKAEEKLCSTAGKSQFDSTINVAKSPLSSATSGG
jgi:amino acid adenylation domain-containing protein